MRVLSAILLLAGSPLFSAPLSAQAVLLDEGSFVVSIRGRTVGTETFRIGRSGLGENAQVIAQGSLELNREGREQTIQSALGTVGIGMSLDAYQARVSGPGALQVLLRRRGDRLVAETTSEEGVEERVYRRPLRRTPTVLLDHLLAHHYFFLAPYQRPGALQVSIIRPRPGSQARGVLRMESVEPLTIGDRTLQAQRLQLVLDGTVHEIWVDSQNRVLRVEIAGDGYAALRRDPPS